MNLRQETIQPAGLTDVVVAALVKFADYIRNRKNLGFTGKFT